MSDVFTGRATTGAEEGGFAFSRMTPPATPEAAAPDPAVEQARQAAAAVMAETERRLAEPMTRDDAIKLREQLFADEVWSKKYLEGSPDRRKQLEKIVAVINENPNKQTDAQAEIERQRVQYDLPPEAVAHITENKSVTAAEKYAAQQKRRELMSQPDFVKAYLGGQLNEARTLHMLNIIIASPLAEAE